MTRRQTTTKHRYNDEIRGIYWCSGAGSHWCSGAGVGDTNDEIVTQPINSHNANDVCADTFHVDTPTTGDSRHVSDTKPAVNDQDDVYDTDLGSDDDECGVTREIALNDYVTECEQLGITPVKYFQRHFHDKIFVMRNHGLGPLGTKALASAVERNIHIEKIDLEGNQIEAEGAKHIADMLKENISVTELVLSENAMGRTGVAAICEMLAGNRYITSVDLSGNLLKDLDGHLFSDILKTNSTLRCLTLRHNELSTISADCFREALSDTENLQLLDLSWNHIRLKAANHIAEMVTCNYGLTTLNLAMNGISDEGAKFIGESLKHNRCLTELNVTSNRISAVGAAFIAQGLRRNDALQTLRIGQNPVGVNGSLALLRAIHSNNENTCLRLLDLTNVVVLDAFDKLHERVNMERSMTTAPLAVNHGGVLSRNGMSCVFVADDDSNPGDAFLRDPITKLRNYASKSKYRLIDVFRQFDTDNSWKLDREKIIHGVNKYRLDMTSEEVDILMSRLDVSGDGQIYYGEMVLADSENRKEQRRTSSTTNVVTLAE